MINEFEDYTEVVSIKWFRIKDKCNNFVINFIGTINIDCSLFDAHNKNLISNPY
ncbi:hypothetical protein NW066_02460 [Mycoplasmopsis felis]|uniref:hypothetical protein n=1 Tax=Mycoplasmopsis felis TaxID=33923 RepID=UPI0021AF1C61|nr:hypothetical protein [Mycoplasmopsis felis]UWV85532.1 hypothetical protein NW066_02460 [Mycoplasmopsis felis]